MKDVAPSRLIGHLHSTDQLVETLDKELLDIDGLNGRKIEGRLDNLLVPLGPELIGGIVESPLSDIAVKNQ
jgi:hypothetical protein